jgi:hypothetical protein
MINYTIGIFKTESAIFYSSEIQGILVMWISVILFEALQYYKLVSL